MARKSRGTLSKRTKLLKAKRKITVNDHMKQFNIGDKVRIKIAPYFRGLPHPRYNDKVGIVKEKRGSSYVIEIKDGNKKKELITNPVHIVKV